MTTSTLSTYVVYATHPTQEDRGVVSVQLVSTSRGSAVARARGTLTHREGDVAWLDALYHVAAEVEGVHVDEDLWAATDEAVAAFCTMVDEAPALAYVDHQFVPDTTQGE